MKLLHFSLWITACAILAGVTAAHGQEVASGSRPLTVVSYNIHHGANQAGEEALTSQGLAMDAANPDFVGLQEVDVRCRRSGNVDQIAVLARLTGMHEAFAPHFEFQGGEYGLGLLSRYPLTDVRNDRITLFKPDGSTETRALLSAEAAVDSRTTVIIATVHMGLDPRTRLKQAEEIIDYLGTRGAPVILTGDFNAEPETPEIAVLESVFENAGAAAQKQFTYPVGKPVKTIDYIMVTRPHLGSIHDFKVMRNVECSDHYPLISTVEVKRK